MTITSRIGQFLFFLGFLGLVIFFATSQAGMPRYLYLCSGVVLFIIGVYLMWTYRNPAQPSERFSTLRKMSQNRAEKRQNLEELKYSQGEQRGSKKE